MLNLKKYNILNFLNVHNELQLIVIKNYSPTYVLQVIHNLCHSQYVHLPTLWLFKNSLS